MATVVFPFLKYIGPLKDKMLKLRWESIEEIKEVKTPLLFISGTHDQLVPAEMTHRLSQAASTKCVSQDMMMVPGGQHNTTFLQAGHHYIIKLNEFMNKCNGNESKKSISSHHSQ